MKDTVRYALQRLNVKAAAMIIATIFAVAGVLMVYAGFRDEGSIDIKTAFLEGKLKSGFVGIVVLFMSLVICLGCLVARRDDNKIEFKRGTCNVKWSGHSPDVAREFMDILSRKLTDTDDHENTPS